MDVIVKKQNKKKRFKNSWIYLLQQLDFVLKDLLDVGDLLLPLLISFILIRRCLCCALGAKNKMNFRERCCERSVTLY